MATECLAQLWRSTTRRKVVGADVLETPLKRCLNLFDLLLFGFAQMIGAGIYVISGTIAKDIAGPGIVLSFVFAGVAAALTSLCYAEFGARVPKAGSGYTFTYVTMGEFLAFLIGWNMILEYLIASPAIARAWSGAFDTLFNGAIRNGTMEYIGTMHVMWLSEYPDFLALGVVLAIVVFVAAGAQVSAKLNIVLTVINLLVLGFIMILGFTLADPQNWTNPATGGFLPFGFSGALAGAATCFFAYVGFEGIANAAEETKDPAKMIPRALLLSVTFTGLIYIGCSASLTLMESWKDVDIAAPFPVAFAHHGITWAKYIVAVGSLVGMSACIQVNLFSLSRTVYAIASDGLFFRAFQYVNSRTQTPLLSIIFFGLLTGIIALLIDLKVLVELMSIGTLLCFTIVAASIIVLHYEPVARCQFPLKPDQLELLKELGSNCDAVDKERILKTSQIHDDIGKLKKRFRSVPVLSRLPAGRGVVLAVGSMTVFTVAFWLLVLYGTTYLLAATWWSILLLTLISAGLILSYTVLLMHEQNTSFHGFQVPLTPLLPAFSLKINIGLMMQLNPYTWIRLLVWVIVGLVIYFSYGIWYSSEAKTSLLDRTHHVASYSSTADTDSQIPLSETKAAESDDTQKEKSGE